MEVETTGTEAALGDAGGMYGLARGPPVAIVDQSESAGAASR